MHSPSHPSITPKDAARPYPEYDPGLIDDYSGKPIEDFDYSRLEASWNRSLIENENRDFSNGFYVRPGSVGYGLGGNDLMGFI